MMRIRSFQWDQENEDHVAEHGVAVVEVEELILFRKPLYQRGREGKYIAYGATEEGRYLFVVFVFKGAERIRVISARDMTNREKRLYKKRKGVR